MVEEEKSLPEGAVTVAVVAAMLMYFGLYRARSAVPWKLLEAVVYGDSCGALLMRFGLCSRICDFFQMCATHMDTTQCQNTSNHGQCD